MFKSTVSNTTRRKTSKNPFKDQQSTGTLFRTENQFEEAIVTDVIVSDDKNLYPEYADDGYNVGVIKCRFIRSNWYVEDGALNYAFPLDANITEYPLINEVVVVFWALNRLYYTRKLNVSNRVTSQPFFGLAAELGEGSDTTTSQNYLESQANPKTTTTSGNDKLGKYFIEIPTIYRLRHQEGDLVVEGRSGHSIRFGMNKDKQQAPNLLIRVGQNPEATPSVQTQFGVIDEDINKDLTSIWAVTNQDVPIQLSTVGNQVHFKSVVNAPTSFGGNQMIINSDRVIINTKQDKVLIHSFDGIHFTTLQDITLDANRDYISFVTNDRKITVNNDYLVTVTRNTTINVSGDTVDQAKGNHALIGSKVHIGSVSNEDQPIVLGEELRTLLLDFVNAHLDNEAAHVMTPTGTGRLMPNVIASLTKIRNNLNQGKTTSILSQDNFVVRTNEVSI